MKILDDCGIICINTYYKEIIMSLIINNETYYTAKELAVKFNVCMETIRLWRKKRGLKGHLIGERKYFYTEKEIEKFVKGE